MNHFFPLQLMSYFAHQYLIWTTWNLCFRMYFFIPQRRSQKSTIIFFTFGTGVELTSWCLLRPWYRVFNMGKVQGEDFFFGGEGSRWVVYSAVERSLMIRACLPFAFLYECYLSLHIWRKSQIGCKFRDRGKLAVNSKKEANWLSIHRKSQQTILDYSHNNLLKKKMGKGLFF